MGTIADVCDRDALDLAVAEVVDRFGRVDVAIANAGILSRAGTLRTTPTPQLSPCSRSTSAALSTPSRRRWIEVIAHRGQFVLISSVFAFLNGMGTIPYAMSKAAVEQLGRGLRVELAAHGVSTTIAYFSLIETNMIKQGVDADPLVDELLASLPRPFLKRLQPDTAATALANGLAHRSPRVVEPSRWKPLSALRGLLAPAMDSHLIRDRRTLAALSQLDTRSHTAL